MKKALVVGGSGLIGSNVIELLLADSRYTVTSLVRKPWAVHNNQLTEVVFNFDNPDRRLVVGDEVFCCLGTTIKMAGSKDAFYKVDHDYVVEIAQLAQTNGAKKFAMVSSLGANKNAPVFYSKVKGITEEAVSNIGYEGLFIFRPSLLLGHRKEFRLGELVSKVLMTVFSFAIPKKYKAIQARQVAKAMIASMNTGQTGVHVIESDRIATM